MRKHAEHTVSLRAFWTRWKSRQPSASRRKAPNHYIPSSPCFPATAGWPACAVARRPLTASLFPTHLQLWRHGGSSRLVFSPHICSPLHSRYTGGVLQSAGHRLPSEASLTCVSSL